MYTFREYLYYILKKRSEKAHRAYYRDYYKNYTDAFERCDQKKAPGVIRREMKALEKYWRVDPVHYYRYGFYRRDCALTLEQMKEYVPDFFAYYLVFPMSFKDRNMLCEDKQLMYAVNKGLGIRQPKTLFFIRGGRMLSEELNPLDLSACREILAASKADKIFVKPTFGVGGKGIQVFNRRENGFSDPLSGERLDAEFLFGLAAEEYVVQEGVRQHPGMNEFYPHAVNTFRVITRCENGRADIVLTLSRMGCGGRQVDNASSGGVYVKINALTGELGAEAIADTRETFTAHPDTHRIFAGSRIPMWDQVREFAISVAEKYAPIKYVGWDVALSEEGPLLIEGNNGPSIEITQDLYGGIKKYLDIDCPDDYWYSDKYSLKNL